APPCPPTPPATLASPVPARAGRPAGWRSANAGVRIRDMDAWMIAAVRTPFGRHRGGLSTVRVDDLAALPIAELVKRVPPLDPVELDDVILGDTNGAGEDNEHRDRMGA